MSHVKSRETVCTGCRREPRKPGQRWGRNCHAAYMRRYRATQKLSDAERDQLALADVITSGLRRMAEGMRHG